jgi:hypothetical protein
VGHPEIKNHGDGSWFGSAGWTRHAYSAPPNHKPEQLWFIIKKKYTIIIRALWLGLSVSTGGQAIHQNQIG